MANLFPRSANTIALKLVFAAGVAGAFAVGAVWYYFTPKYTRVGYQPVQPVAFSHEIHAKQLGMDCRHCHSFVEVGAHSNVPNTQTCMHCHSQVLKTSPKLAPVRESWETGKPIEWVQIHKTPDYVYFNHAVHVNRGVSCASCHGKVNEMPVVFHDQPQSMAWCLDCHRQPWKHLRPREEVFNLDWQPPAGETQERIGKRLMKEWNVNPSQNCAACHR